MITFYGIAWFKKKDKRHQSHPLSAAWEKLEQYWTIEFSGLSQWFSIHSVQTQLGAKLHDALSSEHLP